MERQSSIIITAILLATVAAAGVVYLLSRGQDPYERELALVPTQEIETVATATPEAVVEATAEPTPEVVVEETYQPVADATQEGAVSGIAHVPPTAATGGPLTLALSSIVAGSGIAVTLGKRTLR